MKATPRRIAFQILMLIAVLVVLLVVGSAVAIWLGLGPAVHSRQVATQFLNFEARRGCDVSFESRR